MENSKNLFLLDAYALIYRGYYAFIKNPRINSKGTDTSAILGFMNSLFEIIRTQNPDYLAVAFDKGGSLTRSEMFEEYKSNRDKTPEPILVAIPYIKKIFCYLLIFPDFFIYRQYFDDKSSFPGSCASLILVEQRAISKSTWGLI